MVLSVFIIATIRFAVLIIPLYLLSMYISVVYYIYNICISSWLELNRHATHVDVFIRGETPSTSKADLHAHGRKLYRVQVHT